MFPGKDFLFLVKQNVQYSNKCLLNMKYGVVLVKLFLLKPTFADFSSTMSVANVIFQLSF